MKKLLAAIAATLGLATGLPASAALLVGSSTFGASAIADYSADGLISFDADLANDHSVRLDYALGAVDLAAPIDFNAVLRNYTGAGLSQLLITLSLSSFDTVGTVTRTFGGSTDVLIDGSTAWLKFSSLEFLDISVGDPLGLGGGAIDWAISTFGLHAGDRLSITVGTEPDPMSVPEPTSLALALAAIGLLGWTTSRRARG